MAVTPDRLFQDLHLLGTVLKPLPGQSIFSKFFRKVVDGRLEVAVDGFRCIELCPGRLPLGALPQLFAPRQPILPGA